MKSPNPSGRSPAEVLADAAYEHQPSDPTHDTYPSSDQVVVRHKATGTLWACTYAVREDDSDFEYATSWYQVEAQVRTITTYKRVS